MNNNKETKKYAAAYNVTIYVTLIFAALKLDGHLDIPWMIVVAPVILNLALKMVGALIGAFVLGIVKIYVTVRENKRGNHLRTNRAYGSAIHWDYKTKSFYDAAGNKIDNIIEDEEEQD